MFVRSVLLLMFGGLAFGWKGLPAWSQETDPASVFAHPLQAPNSAFDTVGATLRSTPVLRASFHQEKKLKALRRPLISSGLFLFSVNHGVAWFTQKPFDTRFVITEKGIRQQSAGGEPQTIAASAQPVISGFAKVFLALFGGDTKVLQEHFKVFFEGTPDQWTLGLEPRSPVMGKMIRRIILVGGSQLQRIHFMETSGDTSVIDLKDVRVTPNTLTPEEQTYFAF